MLLNPYRFGPPLPTLADLQAIFSGIEGALYDFTDPGTLFQDSARAIPATVGSVVGGVTDLSGNNRHLIGPAVYTTMQVDGGVHYLNCSGGGQLLAVAGTINGLGSTAGTSVVSAYRAASHATQMCLLSSDRSSGRLTQGIMLQPSPNAGGLQAMYWHASGGLGYDAFTEAATRSAGVDHVASLVYDTAGAALQLDGAVMASHVSARTLFAQNGATIAVGCNDLGTSAPSYQSFNGRIYNATIVGKPLSPSERLMFETYFAARAGM